MGFSQLAALVVSLLVAVDANVRPIEVPFLPAGIMAIQTGVAIRLGHINAAKWPGVTYHCIYCVSCI